MKASVMRAFGDIDVLKYEDVATPTPGPGDVLVKVLAAGINRLDHYIRQGEISTDIPLPHVLGADAVGEIAELGAGVTGHAIGDRVVIVPGFPTEPSEYDISPAITAPSFVLPGLGIWGTYAQFIMVPARFALRDDTGVPIEELASVPVVLATSVRALAKIGGITAGDRVLVQAGASGSGSMLLQVATALGARVATTVRDDMKAKLVKDLGAELVINTRREDPVAKVREWTDGAGVDVVIDNLGGEVLAQSIEAAKPMGTIVAFGFAAGADVSFDVRKLFFEQKRLVGSMASDTDDLRVGLELVRNGRVRPVLDRTLPLSRADEAHRLLATGQVAGNLVLLPWAA